MWVEEKNNFYNMKRKYSISSHCQDVCPHDCMYFIHKFLHEQVQATILNWNCKLLLRKHAKVYLKLQLAKYGTWESLIKLTHFTAQKMKFSLKDLFIICDQIRRKLRIWSGLLKKSLMENVIF